MRLLIVSDRIPEDLRLAVAFLPSSVLLSAVELQPHSRIAADESLVLTGINTVSTTGAGSAQSKAQKYFGRMRLSLAEVDWTDAGYIVSQALDRGKLPTPAPSRPYEDHLEKLVGVETAPGKMLEMLRAKTLGTDSRVHEGRTQLTFRLWNLAGLNAQERNKELWLELWITAAVGREQLNQASGLLKQASDLFGSLFRGEDFKRKTKTGFFFQPITSNSDPKDVVQLAQKIEAFYEGLHEMKLKK